MRWLPLYGFLTALSCGFGPNSFAEEPSQAGYLNALKGNATRVIVEDEILRFEFEKRPESNELRIPRLHARLKAVYWNSDPTNSLTLIPEPTEWVVKLKNPPVDDKVLIVELLDSSANLLRQVTVEGKKSESMELPAHFAETHGTKLRFEPQPHKNTVGYWTIEQDWTSWSLRIPQSGTFEIDILQGCGTGQGGSEVDVQITADKTMIDQFTFVVEETGHFQNFKKRRIGRLTLPKSGNYQLEIRPKRLANKAVMDVRKVILTPTKQ